MANEGHVMDLCMEHAFDIVTKHIARHSGGIDQYAGDRSPASLAGPAAHIAIQLYNRIAPALETDEGFKHAQKQAVEGS